MNEDKKSAAARIPPMFAALLALGLLAGCTTDTLKRTGFNALSQIDCRTSRVHENCVRSYDEEYEKYQRDLEADNRRSKPE